MLEGGETPETLAPPPVQDASRLKRPRVTSPGSKTLIEPEHGSARSPSLSASSADGGGNSARTSPSHRLPRYPIDAIEPPRKGPRLEPRLSPRPDALSEHRPALAPYPTIVQRRAEKSMQKVPNLYLTPSRDGEVPEADTMGPSVRSAPPQQHHFGSDARLPPPSLLFRASRRESLPENEDARKRQLPTALHQQDLQGYFPTPGGTPRLHLPPQGALPSPAYHTVRMDPHTPRVNVERMLPAYEYSGRVTDASDAELASAPLRSPMAQKAQFLSLFSDFFDSLADSRTLKATLEHQIRASHTLLQTLQRSNEVFEQAVEQRVKQETMAWETHFARLEDRIKHLESRLPDA